MEEKKIKEIEVAGKKIVIETGELAKQANGSVVVRSGDTMVLVTACAAKEPREGIDFFPLTVEYREKFYAAGRIPGGFFKREGRPREKETLTARLIDRPIRPLFPKGFYYEVQIIATVISSDKQTDADTLALIGASTALDISDIPFSGPVAAVRVGRIDGQYVINPTNTERVDSDVNVIIAGTKDAVTMIEGETDLITEEEMLEVIETGHNAIIAITAELEDFKKEAGKEKKEPELRIITPEFEEKIVSFSKPKMLEAMKIEDKIGRGDALLEARKETLKQMEEELGDEFAAQKTDIKKILEETEASIIRNSIARDKIRSDGRKFDEIRDIKCAVEVIPRTHGSGLFTRGQTQALVVATLGADDSALRMDDLEGDRIKKFYLQYNFPPFSVGETGRMGTGRREIGHGNLAERAIKAVMPDIDDFPYTVQVVSDILESNGSSSMASVCGASLALMDAGVPLKKPVAGIAMGLIKEGDDFIILTDIQGAEDHFGDMDFKVAGTEDGISAIQMDIKIDGVSKEIMAKALAEAKKARLFILHEKMNKVISAPKEEMSVYAPKMVVLQINKEKIKDLIGPGGKNIKRLVEETGAKIDIDQDGGVNIFAEDKDVLETTIQKIKELTAEAEEGKMYTGVVKTIKDFGAFVEIMPGTDGLVHVSQIAKERVNNVEDYLKEGQVVNVVVKEVDRKTGKISLTMKDVDQGE
ncbi:MAG: polyribonucleotide nucleotidyltransferase [Candidatus Goldiibacteriota bacterium]